MADGTDAAGVPGESFPDRPGRWHPVALAFGWGLSAVLLASWLVEPTRSVWIAMDEAVFWALNDSLSRGKAWQVFWALANSRASDVVAAFTMIGLYLHFMHGRGRDARDRLIAVGTMLTGLVIVSVQIGKAIPYSRLSATLVYPGALRLAERVSWIPVKDSSTDTFPGDHATVLLVCAGVITFYLPRAYAVGAWILAVTFMAPRVVDGAHWLSDETVGAVAIAGAVLTCTFATPLHRIMTDRLERLIRRVPAHGGRSPYYGRSVSHPRA